MRWSVFLFICILLLFATDTFGSEESPGARFSASVDNAHTKVSQRVTSIATSLDGFLSNQKSFDESNSTRIHVSMAVTAHDSGEVTNDANVKIQLVLPQTEKRTRLIVENIADRNADAVAARTSGSSSTVAGNYHEADKSSAFLRQIIERSGFKVTADLGLKIGEDIRPMAKLRIGKTTNFGDWRFLPFEQLTLVSKEGLYSATGLDLENNLSVDWFFRYTNAIEWTESTQAFHFINGPSWYYKWSDRRALTYNLRLESTYESEIALDDCVLSFVYRQLLYENWLFFSVIPMVHFPKELDYQSSTGITIKFDAVFGNLDDAISEFFSSS